MLKTALKLDHIRFYNYGTVGKSALYFHYGYGTLLKLPTAFATNFTLASETLSMRLVIGRLMSYGVP